jgi:hypothetical protein
MGLILSTDGAGTQNGVKLPFQQQIDFFNQKLALPSNHYDDILKSAHDKAFIVAGAAKADLINDFHGAVKQAINDGKTLEWFRSEFDSIVKKHGWDYNGNRDWRTRVIYQTNLSTSYAAGRWQQLNDPDLLKVRPYWKYIHNDAVAHPRALHQSWNGTVLRHDDPWWSTHFCPNGWGCRCRIMAVSAKDYKGHPAPDDGTYNFTDRNGVTHTLPNGVDYGFDYAMGASTNQTLTALVSQKLINYPPAISKALRTDLLKVAPPIPMSSTLQLPTGTWAQDVAKTVLTAIDDTHSVGILPKTRLKTEATLAFDAAYSIDSSVIGLSTFAPQPELSMLHEIGHLIDNQAIGDIDIFASKSHLLLAEWRKAIANSAATKALNDLRGIIAADRLTYYLDTHEQWARSYTQYITQQSNNPILSKQLRERLADDDLAGRHSQWQDSDFTPIMTAINNLFVQLGWKNAD